MSNKMLIDASHPEETRVAVVRGNRIEEFDFESQEKRQLKGNIYLAKVTRVEPSLQAAFIDYGGNRHGFLAFSEIHPDYYQIPVADRQALLEAEAAEARAAQEAENNEQPENDDENGSESELEAEAPRKKSRRRRGKKKNAEAASEDAESDGDNAQSSGMDAEDANSQEVTGDNPADLDADAASSGTADTSAATDNAETSEETPEAEAKQPTEEKPKKRRNTRRKTKKDAAESAPGDELPNAEDDDTDGDDDQGDPKVMPAVVETDSISEPLPGEEENEPENEEEEPVAEEKPKPRRTSRPRTRKTSKAVEAEASSETDAVAEPAVEQEASEASRTETDETANGDENDADETGETKEKAKPKRRSSRRGSRKKKTEEDTSEVTAKADGTAVDESDSDEAGEDDASGDNDRDRNGDDVESVGQEDELEEIAKPRRMRKHYKIQEVIKRRQVLLVQVVKEERGNKGAALTTYLSLAGRYSVLMPNTAKGGGISRKITNSADRKRLKTLASELEVPAGMGVILRTSCATRTDAEIRRDFEYLMRLWEQVRTLTLSSIAPCLVYEEGSLIKRSIRDLYDKDTNEVIVSGEQGFEEAKEFMAMLMPDHVRKVKRYKGSQALFTKFGVETQLEKMLTPQVTLKSGGYLVINQTEALVAVDVNSGRATREHSVENTALQTNLEAAEEVSRQLRLRDLAGLIVIDFIDMEERRNNRAVEKKLKECLKHDRARIQVGRISHFGLMEMSRQRMRASVLESTMDVCEHCGGTGYVRSNSAIALHVFRAIEEHVSRHNRFDCVVKTAGGTALHILNHKRAAIGELEERYGLKILIEASETAKGQEFSIHKGEAAQGTVQQAAIGMQNAPLAEDTETDADEQDAEETTSRRGRGRGRGRRSKDRDSEAANSEQTDSETSVDDDENGVDENEGRRKRRRGKRGGRKNRDQVAQDDEGNRDETPKAAETENNAAIVEGVDAESADESGSEKPKRRSTRRKKAPVAAKPEPADDADEGKAATATDTAEASGDTEPQETVKPKRRRVSRPGRVAAEANKDAGTEAVSEPTQEADKQETGKGGSETQADGKGKKPWWSGGGFF